MIGEITIGQYFPGKSLIHKLDARAKIILTIAFITILFIGKNFFSLALLLAVAVSGVFISRISFSTLFKGLKAVLFILIFSACLQIYYKNTGDILWKPFPERDFAVTTDGVFTALFITVRIIALIIFGLLLTYTTSPTMLTDAIERLLSPLKVFKINVHSFAMMMTIALRFVPTLIEEIGVIMSAQKSRGANMDTGSLSKRAKALVPVFVPLFVNSFRRAYELAFAMECRCYNGSSKRTRMKIMKLGVRDYAMLAFALLLTGAVVWTSWFCPWDNIFFAAVM